MNKDDNKVLDTLDEHTKKFSSINRALDEHTKVLDEHTKVLDEHTKRFKKIDKALDKHDKRLSSVESTCTHLVSLVMQNTADIKEIKETMATKADVNRIFDLIDDFTGRTNSNEEQITIGAHQLKRTDNRVDVLEKDMGKVKSVVGVK